MGRERASSESSSIPEMLRTQQLPAALPLVNEFFLNAAAAALYMHCRAKNNWFDCDEALNYKCMQLTFDNFSGHLYQLSAINSDYAGSLGWVAELVSK
jgi:hypothetical protein